MGQNNSNTGVSSVSASSEAAPTAEALAAFFGVPLAEDRNVNRYTKPLPGYVGIVGMAAQHLDQEANGFAVHGVTAVALRDVTTEQTRLAALEAVCFTVHRSLFVQRATVDNTTMKLLRKIARAIRAEKDAALELRWKFLLDYLAQFSGGKSRTKAAKAAGAAAANGVAPK